MLNENVVEVKGYTTTKAKGSTIGFKGLDVNLKVAKRIKLSNSNVKVELTIEHRFEVEGYNTTKLGSFKLGFRVLMSKSKP